jgi:hypothetical protein
MSCSPHVGAGIGDRSKRGPWMNSASRARIRPAEATRARAAAGDHWKRAVLAATATWMTAPTIAAAPRLVREVVRRQLRALIAAGKVTARIPREGHPVRYRARCVTDAHVQQGGGRGVG